MTDEVTNAKSKFWDYNTDQKAEADGVWVTDVLPGLDSKVRSYSSPQAKAWRRKRQNKQAGMIKALGELPQEQAEENELEMLADTILVDWRGPNAPFWPEGENEGEPMEGTDPKIRRLVLDSHRPYKDAVKIICMTDSFFGAVSAESLEEIQGN